MSPKRQRDPRPNGQRDPRRMLTVWTWIDPDDGNLNLALSQPGTATHAYGQRVDLPTDPGELAILAAIVLDAHEAAKARVRRRAEHHRKHRNDPPPPDRPSQSINTVSGGLPGLGRRQR